MADRIEFLALPIKETLKRISQSNLRHEWIILLAYILATLILTVPLVFHLTDGLAGASPDTLQNAWNLWWAQKSVLGFENPFYTNWIYFPDGVSLLFHTLNPTNGVLSLPFQLAFGLVAADNLIVLTSFVLTAYTQYLLTYQLLKHRGAAFLSGLILSFSPYHLAHLWGGQLQLLSLQWLPLCLYYLLRTLGTKRKRDAVVTASLLAWIVFTDWYYALFTLIGITILVVAHRFGTRARPRALLLPMSIGLGVGLVLILPLLIPMMREAATAGYVQPGPNEAVKFSADLTAFVVPSALNPILRSLSADLTRGYTGGIFESTASLGLVPLVLMVFGLARRKNALGAWLVIWTVGFVLSLGPVVHVLGRFEFGPNHVSLPAPYALVAQLPLLQFARSVSRFVVLTMLSLGILAGAGWREVLRWDRIRYPVNYWILIAGVGFFFFEFIAIPIPLTSAQTPAFADQLARDSTITAIHDLPVGSYPLDARYMFYQTMHQKPITEGYVSRLKPHLLLQALVSEKNPDPDIITQPPDATPLELLRSLNISHVVVHRNLSGDLETSPLGSLEPIYNDESTSVYSLQSVSALPIALALDENWYPPDYVEGKQDPYRWIKEDASVLLFVSRPTTLRLEFAMWSFNTPRHLILAINGERLARLLVPSDTIRYVTTPTFHVRPGANWVSLHSVESSNSGVRLGMNQDTRLLSIAIANITALLNP